MKLRNARYRLPTRRRARQSNAMLEKYDHEPVLSGTWVTDYTDQNSALRPRSSRILRPSQCRRSDHLPAEKKSRGSGRLATAGSPHDLVFVCPVVSSRKIDRVGRARGAVSPEFSAKRPLADPRALLANWWKGRDSNTRPRHYEVRVIRITAKSVQAIDDGLREGPLNSPYRFTMRAEHRLSSKDRDAISASFAVLHEYHDSITKFEQVAVVRSRHLPLP